MHKLSPDTVDALLAHPSRFLTFPAEIESYFQQKIKKERTRHVVYASCVGILVYLLFALCDRVLLPDVYLSVWKIRLFVGFPLLVFACALFPFIESYQLRESFVAGVAWFVGGITCWMMLKSTAPLVVQEVVGFILFIVYGNVVIRFRFTLALRSSIIFLAFFALISFTANHIPTASHVNNFVLFLATTVLTLISNYRQELDERRNFLLVERDAARKEELQNANATLADLSYRDGLTSAYNKRYFDIRFPLLLSSAQQAGTPLCVMFIDVDHFKAFNDSYGHVAGDKALISVAALLNASFRRRDEILARTGGEEFVGLVPGISPEQGREMAEMIREQVQQLGIPHERSSAAKVVTVSIGVAFAMPGLGRSTQDLLTAADVALYKAKQRGRNQVVVHEQHAALEPPGE
ncbi:GGDEF domain-containing protein [Noviherbaspirillum massiliense]|uniref:GGDEF domain-containing protein n=1 Tax=Noviherbaspirillum massiliense TaxID=1465823 RepID=UPI0003086425|nr:GGDEF domain-containing protein [Noviherbaspirillum massiliense]